MTNSEYTADSTPGSESSITNDTSQKCNTSMTAGCVSSRKDEQTDRPTNCTSQCTNLVCNEDEEAAVQMVSEALDKSSALGNNGKLPAERPLLYMPGDPSE
eukprot:scaffold486591_cov46-Prasinocladus_malaysianus.AAC.1